MDRKNYRCGCNKYANRSVGEVYSKLLCQFSNIHDIQGKHGRKGCTGNKGDIGNEGGHGNKGEQGNHGESGFVGNRGILGDEGNSGIVGNKGDQGNLENSGDKGNQGDQGLRNLGSKGSIGNQGDLGYVGNLGSDGNKGEIINGNKGETGNNGSVGNNAKGDGGENGNEGDKGNKIRGDKGNSANIGDKGNNGTVGTKGFIGDSGISGTSGDPIDPLDMYMFAKNNSESINLSLTTNAGANHANNFIPYNNILNSGISFVSGYPVFTVSQSGTYLITYDIKTDSTITASTTFQISQVEFYICMPTLQDFTPIPTSKINSPNEYANTFISFNRTFLVNLQSVANGVSYGVQIIDPSVSDSYSITLLGGINGPQITVLQIK